MLRWLAGISAVIALALAVALSPSSALGAGTKPGGPPSSYDEQISEQVGLLSDTCRYVYDQLKDAKTAAARKRVRKKMRGEDVCSREDREHLDRIAEIRHEQRAAKDHKV